ncbi:MAG: hypothetical protein V3V08_02655 [Nannocystaceae bacterium]
MTMLKKILFGSLAVGVLVGSGAYYLWSQATALPDWYAAEDRSPKDQDAGGRGEGVAPSGELVWEELALPQEGALSPPLGVAPHEVGQGAPAKPVRKKVPRRLQNFHLHATAKNPALRRAVQASRADYRDGTLTAGVVINLSKIPDTTLSSADRKTFKNALRSFPGLRGRAVYVGLEDRPVTKNGFFQLGPATRVHIGKLDYPLSKVAARLGLREASIRKQINRELRRLKVRDPDVPHKAAPP